VTYLEVAANISQVITGVIAVWAILAYEYRIWSKRTKLEEYLKAEKATGTDKGQHTALHLMAKLGLTQDEVLQASFRSKVIARRLKVGDDGLASQILFEYIGASS
jgi:hypothetical protein